MGARRRALDPFGSRIATVRPDDLGREAGKNLEADPQIQSAFKIVEMLGLGAIPADVKGRSLRIGAATEQALGMARSAFNQDLESLVLPVLEPVKDDPAPAPKSDQRTPPIDNQAPTNRALTPGQRVVGSWRRGWGLPLCLTRLLLKRLQIIEQIGREVAVRVIACV